MDVASITISTDGVVNVASIAISTDGVVNVPNESHHEGDSCDVSEDVGTTSGSSFNHLVETDVTPFGFNNSLFLFR